MSKGKDHDDDDDDDGGNGKARAFGSFFGNDIEFEIPGAERDRWYATADEDIESGRASEVEHDGKGKLTVKVSGIYFIFYSMTADTHLPGGRVQTGILVNGRPEEMGIQHWSGETTISGGAIVELGKGDSVQIALRATDVYRATLRVEHLNCSVFAVA